MDWYKRLKYLCDQPRRPNHAKGFWVSADRMSDPSEISVSDFGIKLSVSDSMHLLYLIDDDIENTTDDTSDNKPRKGDIICVEVLIPTPGYGIFVIKKSTCIYPLMLKNGKYVVPDIFQVAVHRYAIDHWSDFTFESDEVPFSASDNLAFLTSRQVQYLFTKNRDFGYLSILLRNEKRKRDSYIISTKMISQEEGMNENSKKAFINFLSTKKYLLQCDTVKHTKMMLPYELDYKKILLVK